jgi:hypothetical protein
LKAALFLAINWAVAFGAQAHGFEERYDLPVPLGYVVVGACSAVLLTFVVAVFFVRQPTSDFAPPDGAAEPPDQTPDSHWLPKALVWLLFALTITSALWGSNDPLMNLAPTMIWIVWWVGLSFAVLLLGNFWPHIDPWRSTFDVLDAGARKLGLARGLSLGWVWSARLGAWPAVLLLLAWCWLEVVYPIASTPFKLGCAALLWSVVNLAGMVCFGRDSWQRNADVFALYFSTLGHVAPIPICAHRPAATHKQVAGTTGFVLAMLSTVLFDGLHGGAAWNVFEGALGRLAPHWMDVNGYFAGTMGLLTVWLLFFLAYSFTCHISARLIKPSTGMITGPTMAARFAPTLIPIAAAYNIAHNFSNLLIQGQTIFQLLSDPLGRQWDLFGTAKWYPDIGLVDAKLTWYVAVISIVLGHVLSIWWSHRLALTLGLSAKRTALVTAPLAALMIAYTAISLTVIAEPMVSYTP